MGTFPLSNIYFARNITLAQTGNARAGSHASLLPRRKVRCAPPKSPTVPLPVWKSPRPPREAYIAKSRSPPKTLSLSLRKARANNNEREGQTAFFSEKTDLVPLTSGTVNPRTHARQKVTRAHARTASKTRMSPRIGIAKHQLGIKSLLDHIPGLSLPPPLKPIGSLKDFP